MRNKYLLCLIVVIFSVIGFFCVVNNVFAAQCYDIWCVYTTVFPGIHEAVVSINVDPALIVNPEVTCSHYINIGGIAYNNNPGGGIENFTFSDLPGDIWVYSSVTCSHPTIGSIKDIDGGDVLPGNVSASILGDNFDSNDFNVSFTFSAVYDNYLDTAATLSYAFDGGGLIPTTQGTASGSKTETKNIGGCVTNITCVHRGLNCCNPGWSCDDSGLRCYQDGNNYYCWNYLTHQDEVIGSCDLTCDTTYNLKATAVSGNGQTDTYSKDVDYSCPDPPPPPPPINGSCGPAAKSYLYSDFSYDGTLCSSGTPSPFNPSFPPPGGSSSWTCLGFNEGSNAFCTATRSSVPPTPTLSVSLTADPASSDTGSLITTLEAVVTGTETGTINYRLWKNCDSDCSTTQTCTSACGDRDYFADNSDSETFNVPNVLYSSIGSYKPKVIVERGGSIAEDKKDITVTGSNPPTANIKARPSGSGNYSDDSITITYNTKADIQWTSNEYTDDCEVSSAGSVLWTDVSGTETTGNLTSSQTYTVTCTGSGGTSPPDSVTVNVGSIPSPTNVTATCLSPGNSYIVNWTPVAGYSNYYVRIYDETTNVAAHYTGVVTGSSYTWNGATPGHVYSYWVHTANDAGDEWSSEVPTARTQTVTCALPPVPTVSLSASPTSIPYNTASTLTWTSDDADSCEASGDWSGSKSTSDSQSTGNLTSDKTYILTCIGSGGTSAPDSVTVNVEAPTLSAVLSVNPISGNVPLNDVDLTATAEGNAIGTINYTFYCDWNSASTVPGDNTNNDFKIDGRNPDGTGGTVVNMGNVTSYSGGETFSVNDVCDYSEPGAYTAKVIVERDSLAVEKRQAITVINNSPTVSGLYNNDIDYCSNENPINIILSWQFNDIDADDTQLAYQVQVTKISTGQRYDSGKVDSVSSSITAQKINNELNNFIWYDASNQGYSWKVKAWDSYDAESSWANSSFRTTKHQWPIVDFNWSPINPSQDEDAQFADISDCFDADGDCDSWSWAFIDGSPNAVIGNNPLIHKNPIIKFVLQGTKSVILQVTDSGNYTCSKTKNVNVQDKLPGWEEITPW